MLPLQKVRIAARAKAHVITRPDGYVCCLGCVMSIGTRPVNILNINITMVGGNGNKGIGINMKKGKQNILKENLKCQDCAFYQRRGWYTVCTRAPWLSVALPFFFPFTPRLVHPQQPACASVQVHQNKRNIDVLGLCAQCKQKHK